MNYAECAEILRENDDYILITHIRPDGDTLGSAAALCSALRRLGKRAYLYPNPEITPKYHKYVKDYLAPEGYEGAYTVAVDVAGEHMLAKGFEGKVKLCIDHHNSNSGY
ncbi:MAG: DHH family phosphoesterase, partial [Clostridia bacterium]|nr:DHH family phosphoesterase [Clostridia bacterium]